MALARARRQPFGLRGGRVAALSRAHDRECLDTLAEGAPRSRGQRMWRNSALRIRRLGAICALRRREGDQCSCVGRAHDGARPRGRESGVQRERGSAECRVQSAECGVPSAECGGGGGEWSARGEGERRTEGEGPPCDCRVGANGATTDVWYALWAVDRPRRGSLRQF